MCGIAGYLGNFAPTVLGEMNRRQGHRGPDGSGEWQRGRVGLAHLRLSILDLSANGAQPMTDPAGRVVLTFNGEIYNYRELRRRLEREGVSFRGESDTEVLLQLLALHGTKCLPWLNGIFAFAAWFPAESRLIIARDGAGVKPLYWTKTAEGLAFASELKALCAVPGIDLSLDTEAVSSYLTLLYAPSELTPARGLRKILPGTFHEWKDGEPPRVTKFSPAHYDQEVQVFKEKDAIEACRHYLGQAVRRQLVSDVPLGGFLSGGLDSTAVAHYAVKALGSGERYPCFTLSAESQAGLVKEGLGNDFVYATQASEWLQTPLHECLLLDRELENFDWMVWQLDEPTPDPAAFAAHAVCRQAQRLGVKVLLSGAGGDDIFSGYRRHFALQAEAYWAWAPRGVRAGLRQAAEQLSVSLPVGRRLAKVLRYADAAPPERLASYFLWISQEAISPVLSPAFRDSLGGFRPIDTLARSLDGLPAGVSRLNQMLHLDRSFFLADHNLNYTDKMAMACGVEVRVPFLDPDLVAFTERLPDAFKTKGIRTKKLLRTAMRGIIPDGILDRPKSGFGFPLRALIHGAYGERLRELAHSGRLDATGIFSGQGAIQLLEADKHGQVDAAYPLLGILCVESWIRQFTGR